MERKRTKYVQVVIQKPDMTPRRPSFDNDFIPPNVRFESPEPQFMEIDQAGHNYRNDQLPVPGRTDTQIVSLDQEAAGTSLMDVEEDFGQEIIPVHHNDVTTHYQRPFTNIMQRGDSSWMSIQPIVTLLLFLNVDNGHHQQVHSAMPLFRIQMESNRS